MTKEYSIAAPFNELAFYECALWCEQTIGPEGGLWSVDITTIEDIFSFTHEKDLTAFVLKFMH